MSLQNHVTTKNVNQERDVNLMQSWIIWAMAALFYLYEYVLRVSPSVMTEGLTQSFGVTSTELGVLSSFYYYAYTILQVPCGVIVDKWGPRRVITFSSILCTVGSFQFALSDTLLSAQIGRFLIGAGSACAFLSTLKVAADWFSVRYFVVAAGLTSMMGVLGGVFGARPFAILVNNVGWRSAMIYAAIFGIFVTVLVWFVIKDKKSNVTDLATVSSSSLTHGLKVIMKNPQSWLIAFYGCLMYLPISVFAELWGVPYLMQTFNVTNEVAATASIMIFLGMALGGPTAAWVSNKIQSRYRVMLYSALGSLTFFAGVMFLPSLSLEMIFGMLFFVGICKGGQILCFTCVKEINPSHISGTTIGFTNTVVMLSGVIFQPLLGMILDSVWSGNLSLSGIRIYTADDYFWAMLSIPIALSVNLVLIKFIKESYPKA
ncbi:MAG TPA: MFS transporter [Alphaproteobacteria bacterium]|nr:MFS transporter [Alphaproteobacteria bacterium]